MMDATVQKRTASVVVALTGLLVALSPTVLDMSNAAMWNAILAGGLLALLGIGQLFLRSGVPSVVAMLVTIWFVIAAFIFDQSTAAMWTLAAAGAVGFLASVWDEVAALDVGRHRTSHSM